MLVVALALLQASHLPGAIAPPADAGPTTDGARRTAEAAARTTTAVLARNTQYPTPNTQLASVPPATDPTTRAPNAERRTPPVHTIRYDGQCFTIDGKDLYLYSGAFHYFRCPRPLWRDRLQKIKDAHFNCVETYVAWNWHELRPGRVNLRDLDDFLTVCEQMGLYVIARPGPYICAEWDEGGFPTWLPARVKSLRDDSQDSVRWSKHWFDEVLPVIRRHQITQGGGVVLCQLENEYDYHPNVSDAEKKEYIRALYRMAKANGIDVPLITCWTRAVRDRQDPDMRHIIDTCNFYPRWNVGSTIRQLDQLGAQQPDAPRMVTELQGGWFSDFGGKLSVDQPGVNAAQINALIKTVWAGGVAASSYYMLFGGTNFGYWGAKGITTTYDYAAPIREPGGLWDKYYAVRAAGKFLDEFGPILVRSKLVPGGATTEMPGVWAAERANGMAAFVFVRNDQDAVRDGLVTALDPATGRPFDIRVHLEPHGAKVFPVNLPCGRSAGGSILVRRGNAEVVGTYRAGARTVLVLAGDPGETVQVELAGAGGGAGEGGPGVSATLPADPAPDPDQAVDIPRGPIVMFTTEARAARLTEVPALAPSPFRGRAGEGVAGHEAWPACGGFYRMVSGAATESRIALTAEVAHADHVTVPAERKPRRVTVGATEVPFTYGDDGLIRFAVDPGPMDIPAARFSPMRVNKEMWGGGEGWRATDLRPLDQQGIVENGITRYRALFKAGAARELLVRQYAADPVSVAVNGTPVAVATGDRSGTLRIDLAHVTRPGINRIEVLYENAGRPNFGGPSIWERKGIKSADLLADTEKGITVGRWRVRRVSRPSESPAEAAPGYDDADWDQVGIGYLEALNNRRGWAWYRAHVTVSLVDIALGRTTLAFDGVDDNAIVYVNGRRIATHEGWDDPFTAEARDVLHAGDNVIAVAVENLNGAGGIYKPVTLTRERTGVRITGWEIADRLLGERHGWHREWLPGTPWLKAILPERGTEQTDTVRWYRTTFRLPAPGRYTAPWKLRLDAGGEALIWVNGTLVGRYSDRGPQTEFYLPECWQHANGRPNAVAIAIRDGRQPANLRSLAVLPYTEYATRTMPIAIEF